MLVCKIEMWPRGKKELAYELGQVFIANVGGDADTGEYDVRLMKSSVYATNPGVWKRGKVAAFPRKRLGPYDLLLRALAAACGSRNRAAAEIVSSDEAALDDVALANTPRK